MKYFDWDKEKNDILKEKRDISFEDVVQAIEDGQEIDRITHPNKDKYPNQHIIIINIQSYIYLVPYVEDEEKYFLKTIIPSRKMTKQYIMKGKVE